MHQELVYIKKMDFHFKLYFSHHYRKQFIKCNNLLLFSVVMDYQSASLYFLFPPLLSILQDILDESLGLSQLIPEKNGKLSKRSSLRNN